MVDFVPLGSLIAPVRSKRAGKGKYPVLSITRDDGLVFQSSRFKKRIAGADLSNYKVIDKGQLVVGFPIDEAVIDFQTICEAGIVSPAYGVWKLLDEQRVDMEYLRKYLRSDSAVAQYKLRLRGTTARRRSLTKEAFQSIQIPLPPLAEQRRIAAILDEARVQTNQSDEAGTLLSTMTSSWLSTRSQSVPGVKLSELGTFRGGMTPSKKNPEFWGGDVYWFTTKDLKFGEVDESEERITDRALEETSASLIGEPSIAFSLRGMSLAHRLPMSCIPGEVTVNQDLKAFVPNQSMDRDVVFHLVKLKEMELLSKVSTSAHGTKKLDFRHLKELEIPDPSGEFGFEVRRVLEQTRSVREQIRRRHVASANLFQALSTRAFQGEL